MDCVKKFYFKNLCFSIIEQQSWELGFCININLYTQSSRGYQSGDGFKLGVNTLKYP